MYQYLPYDAQHFATGLRRDLKSNTLIWDSAPGLDVLLVQTPFGQHAEDQMEKICAALGKDPPIWDDFVEVLPGIWIRFLSSTDKIKFHGCPLHGEASTYTVFGFSWDGDGKGGNIYAQQDHSIISPSCDVPLEILVKIEEQISVRRGLFSRKRISSGFYKVTFPDGVGSDYLDGSLYYEVGELKIPITRQMLERRTIFIKSSSAPKFQSRSAGLRLKTS